MKNYVTLFNNKYLPQGLSLYESLNKNSVDFRLWIICVDDICFEILKKLNFENIKLINLSDVENNDLLEVKKDRTIGEYCWTLTPFSADFVFSQDESINEVTYLDADIFFLNKGYLNIFQEFNASEKSILITRHAYSPEYDQSSSSGIYCVQFIIFKRNESKIIREQWQKQCIEWCFNRVEDNKFGDQTKGLGANATPEAWSQMLNIQNPLMQNLMGSYMEQSKDLFLKMQEQMQTSQNMFGGFPFTPQSNKNEKE
jgi:hypothetical protein